MPARQHLPSPRSLCTIHETFLIVPVCPAQRPYGSLHFWKASHPPADSMQQLPCRGSLRWGAPPVQESGSADYTCAVHRQGQTYSIFSLLPARLQYSILQNYWKPNNQYPHFVSFPGTPAVFPPITLPCQRGAYSKSRHGRSAVS